MPIQQPCKTKIVCFGGGTGLPALLSSIKHTEWLDITAIVSTFDNGGSSGELRDQFGILPPGDVLKCMLALSENEVYARKLLLERIYDPDRPKFPGHSVGNLLLLGLEAALGGYLKAVDALGKSLRIIGKVVPVTTKASTLCAEYFDGTIACGETNVDRGIHEGKRIKRLFLDPPVPVSLEAVTAIQEADVLCIGPGSFYTSVLPNFLPEGIHDVVKMTRVKTIYIANLFTEGKGMRDMSLEDFAHTVREHIGRHLTNVIAHDNAFNEFHVLKRYEAEGKHPIKKAMALGQGYIYGNLWTDTEIVRHDSNRLKKLVEPVIRPVKI